MPKILHILPSLNPKLGGLSKAVRDIISGISLQKKDIINEVVCLDNPNSVYLKDDNFIIYALGEGKTPWNYNKNLSKWFVQNITNYDILIVHGLWQYQSYIVYQIWVKLKVKPKLYIMPHGMLDPYFQRAKNRRFKSLRNLVFWHVFEKQIVNNAQGVLFTSEDEKILAKRTFKKYFPKKELVVGLGIHKSPVYSFTIQNSFKEKVNGWNGSPFFLFLSRINEKKGMDLLIKAYLKISLEYREELPQLIIAGPGLETTYGAGILKLASINKNIIFTGMLEGKAKWGAFYNCECFILPSHQENFGIAIVEAMACKKAVLISDKVNIWREIEKENAGFIGKDTEQDTYLLLKKWLNLSLEEKIQIGNNAFKTYKKYFSIEKSTNNLVEVLKK